ncbi:hypothetical protein NE237_018664 [Protea cynaroides]|uniref:Ribosomal protein S19 n=1 Tax=Protea cynaroides TaxID=273540 RepID=A0A9Q0KAF1_9MAGN|nr:hypothetical protein NE237_018664 [Protea cynaroides]
MTTTNEGPTTMKEEKEEEEELIRTESKRRNSEFMPRRSIWKGSFFDAFLLRMQKKRDLLLNRKIWSRRSSISPEFVDCSVRIYNGKTPVRCKITEGKVGHKFGEFASTRKRRPSRTNIGPGRKKGKK